MIFLRCYILIYLLYLLSFLLLNRNINYNNDLINYIYLLLTSFIFPIICLLSNNKIENLLLLILYIILLLLFNSKNLFNFYIYFELTLILLLVLIILFGYKYKKYDAFYKLWIYSIIGSIPLFIIIIYIFSIIGSLNNNILELYLNNVSNIYIRYMLFILIILSLIIKLPSYPFHNWLTLAHVEANTIGSIILASIILKVSIYGIIRYNLIIYYSIIENISSILIYINLLSIIIISNIIINQIDLKLIIAYSSIIHTNYMLISILSYNKIGLYGGLISSIAHSFISTGLFLMIGILYSRYKTRLILYYKGLSESIPIFSIFIFILILSNISLPLTSNFIGELCSFIGYFNNNLILILLLLIYLFITTTYNLIFLNHLIYGKLSIFISKYHDLTYKEFILLLWLIFINFIFGIYPPIII